MQNSGIHPRFLIFSKGEILAKEENYPAELIYLADAYISRIAVTGWKALDDHFEYVLSIYGRTRFIYCLPDNSSMISYNIPLRYRTLFALHKELKAELNPYVETERVKFPIPSFPSKKWFSKGAKLAAARMDQLNEYFTELFDHFGNILLFSQLLLNLLSPPKIDITIISSSKELRNAYLNSLAFLQRKMNVVANEEADFKDHTRKLFKIEEPADCTELFHDFINWQDGNKRIWKKYLPFDYFMNGSLYRIDIKKQIESATNYANEKCSFFIVLIDMGSKESFENIRQKMNNLLKLKGISVLLVGLECEDSQKQVLPQDIQNFSQNFIEASCSTGKNILRSLDELISFNLRSKGSKVAECEIYDLKTQSW